MHQFPKFTPAWNSTCFGHFLCPSSAGPSWSCSKAVFKPVWHIPVPNVQWINSWWWAEELPETCRVSCRSKFGKLVHLVGFKNKEIYAVCEHLYLFIPRFFAELLMTFYGILVRKYWAKQWLCCLKYPYFVVFLIPSRNLLLNRYLKQSLHLNNRTSPTIQWHTIFTVQNALYEATYVSVSVMSFSDYFTLNILMLFADFLRLPKQMSA